MAVLTNSAAFIAARSVRRTAEGDDKPSPAALLAPAAFAAAALVGARLLNLVAVAIG